jgi:phosphoribosylamine--glycine ligase
VETPRQDARCVPGYAFRRAGRPLDSRRVEVLVLGAGAREHALAWRLARDDAVRRVSVAPGNGGTPAVGRTIEGLEPLDPIAVVRHAARERYDLVVVGPEGPLAAGVVDALLQAGIPVFGPSREAARLESSKGFAKEQMRRAGVPTADAAIFREADSAIEHALRAYAEGRLLVVKADWLAAGKGVRLPSSADEAEAEIRAVFELAAPGARILLEERLVGREVSAFALVSGEVVVPLAAACDYKRLADDDVGPNTGGMGAYAPVPWFGAGEMEGVAATVFEPIAWRMTRDAIPYRGVLYAGLMLTDDGPMVLEFNARFGDPEAQVLVPLLAGDLSRALLGTARGERALMDGSLGIAPGASVAVVVAYEGYPEAPVTGRPLQGVEPSAPGDDGSVLCFHAGTRRTAAGWETTTGRVVTVVGRGADLAAAREAAYRGVSGVELEGAQLRRDIAARELAVTA